MALQNWRILVWVTLADTECSFVGTEGFVAREGPGRVQADIYAWAKFLYEMTTGLSAKEFPTVAG